METFQTQWQEAKKKLKLADHMLTMTYPLVNDPKLLLNIAQNLADSMEFTISALLEYERLFKRVPPFKDEFNSKMVLFRTRVMPFYKIDVKYANAASEIRDVLKKHKASPMEFIRRDKVVIADEQYQLRLISPAEIKKFMQVAKDFLEVVRPVVAKNE
ncbi:MAG: hypothetical protein ABIA93_00115 [Candidatus Woesearchaeota archaeon]